MSLWTLILAGLRQRPLIQVLNLLALSLGVALIVALLLSAGQLRDAAQREARGIDLVIGASGSPLQLVLSSVYHADAPTGNIDAGQWPRWRAHPLVDLAVPLALGDSVGGYRLVGTSPDFARLYGLAPEAGDWWRRPMQAVLGSEAAAGLGLGVGDRFVAAHGLDEAGHQHDDMPVTVVGILPRSGRVIDRLVLTSVETVWRVHGSGHAHADDDHDHDHDHEHEHEHEHEHDHGGSIDIPPGEQVTALLIRYRSPMGHVRLPREVNAVPGLQAAQPATEMARLLDLFRFLLVAAQALALLIVLVAALGMFVSLYQALENRRYDIAVLRTLGATRVRVGLLLLGEALVVALGAAALGTLLGHLAVEAVARLAGGPATVPVSGWLFVPAELWVWPLAVLVALLAAALPAWRAYRTDVAAVLARGH